MVIFNSYVKLPEGIIYQVGATMWKIYHPMKRFPWYTSNHEMLGFIVWNPHHCYVLGDASPTAASQSTGRQFGIQSSWDHLLKPMVATVFFLTDPSLTEDVSVVSGMGGLGKRSDCLIGETAVELPLRKGRGTTVLSGRRRRLWQKASGWSGWSHWLVSGFVGKG
jgi:hypothetical protein